MTGEHLVVSTYWGDIEDELRLHHPDMDERDMLMAEAGAVAFARRCRWVRPLRWLLGRIIRRVLRGELLPGPVLDGSAGEFAPPPEVHG